jgi:hypothetical protein
MKPRRVRIDAKRLVEIGTGVYGLPDGSLLIRQGQSPRAPQVQVEGDRPPKLRAGDFIWDNPPGPSQGVTFGLRTGEQYIGPKGLVTPTQASQLLKKSRVWIYRLIRTGKLRPVKKRGAATILIPLSQIRRILGLPEERVRPIRPGALWGYDRKGQPWLVG